MTNREILLARRIFPAQDTPNAAFRNLGELKFTENASEWGFDTKGVSHGMACGDLDGDGCFDTHSHPLRTLWPDGLVVMQLGELDPRVADATARTVAALRAEFAWLEFGSVPMESFNSTWGFAFASHRQRDRSPPQLKARIEAAALGQLRYYSPHVHQEFWVNAQGAQGRASGLVEV